MAATAWEGLMSIQGGVLFFIVLFDAFLTGCGVNAGHMEELNPYMSWMINNAGVFLFIMFKAMFVLLAIAHFDRMLKSGDESSRSAAIYCYKLAIGFYTGYFVFGWIAANHAHVLAIFR